MANDVHINLRLPQALVDLADELVPIVAEDPDLQAIGRINRSAVLRLAITRGLRVLDREYRGPRDERR